MKLATAIPALLVSTAAIVTTAVALNAFAEDAKTVGPVRDVLIGQMGKRVAVRLNGDADIEGTVASVGADSVLLTKVSGKDFYDSVLIISKISAVTFKARDK
ncbi:MAG: hypothetical protein ABI905_06650 [Betaproteobacteria bacterium]